MKLPPVINFLDLIRGKVGSAYRYVDKTPLIREIVSSEAAVHWILQPMGFGKSLQLDMLMWFFSVRGVDTLFRSLQIAQDEAFCKAHQVQYPVIFLDLGRVAGNSFNDAYTSLSGLVSEVFDMDFPWLRASSALTDKEQSFCRMCAAAAPEDDGTLKRPLSSKHLQAALGTLARLLKKQYGRKPILLVDNADLPLHQAWLQRKQHPDWFNKMETLLQVMLRPLLGDPSALSFAVLTGALPNTALVSLSDPSRTRVWSGNSGFSQPYFGFTPSEVNALLSSRGTPEELFLLQRWCGGHRFGDTPLYHPAEVFRFLQNLSKPASERATDFSQDIAREATVLVQLLRDAPPSVQEQYLRLMAGQSIVARRIPNFSYRDLEQPDGIWNYLTASGILTVLSQDDVSGQMTLQAPNLQARMQLGIILERWFHSMGLSKMSIHRFCHSFDGGGWNSVEFLLPGIWDRMRKAKPEDTLYFGLLLGIPLCRWLDTATLDCGDGYCAISYLTEEQTGVCVMLRFQFTESAHTEAQIAARQLEENKYPQALLRLGCEKLILYGVAWDGKDGSVVTTYPSMEYAAQLYPE